MRMRLALRPISSERQDAARIARQLVSIAANILGRIIRCSGRVASAVLVARTIAGDHKPSAWSTVCRWRLASARPQTLMV
jgi:hypothetical protein